MTTKPAHEIRFGRVRVTIWPQTSDKGTWFQAVPSKSFKDADGNWKETDRYSRDEILVLAKALEQAFLWISQQKITESDYTSS